MIQAANPSVSYWAKDRTHLLALDAMQLSNSMLKSKLPINQQGPGIPSCPCICASTRGRGRSLL